MLSREPSRDYLEARSLFNDMTPSERLTYARVLYGMGCSPSTACLGAPHPQVNGSNGESTYCTIKTTCSCDCHLSNAEYADMHETS